MNEYSVKNIKTQETTAQRTQKKKNATRVGQRALWVKSFPCKHEDPAWITRICG